MTIPDVPEQNPDPIQPIYLPSIPNPYLSVWWATQTVSNVPENVMGWLVAQGYEITGITQDTTTTPPTNYFSLTREGMRPQDVLLSLCNSYTFAANNAQDANQIRYNAIVNDWLEMIDTSHDQFNAQTAEQNAQAGVFLTDLDDYMTAIETLIDDNQSHLVADATEAKIALISMDMRLTELEDNAAAAAVTIRDLLTGLDTNVNTYVAEIEAILALLDADYASVSADLAAIRTSTGTLVATFKVDYEAALAYLESDYTAHAALTGGLLDGLGSTELARINEEFGAKLTAQLQMLTSRGLYTSALVADITERNHRDRDEQIQLLNDRLMREKLENQHRLYAQQFGMRNRVLDGISQLHGVQQEVLKYQASLISGTYELLQNIRNRILAGQQAILAARDANVRLGVQVNSTLLEQLQGALTGVLGGKERFSTLLMQNANVLSEHKHRAIAERMNTAAQRLDGWKSVAAENRQLMAYQLDERNKLLIGLYSFVERRNDIAPEWRDMATMIASLGDSGGGWVTP
ncbi:hypothetical protein E6Q11_00965 [Candidatus Dojkabacteria bacterium]|uniref:Uncharacterized protein n=1 Tax=Candidatus Dojkabacteria bacterium TaxID=2099670 RepID=A0A5C7JBT3_9BACT|nr:MAG: hypothetical protein E6Q11_00965 [Candidatus Dojkabacteria bacterium]